MIFDIAQLIVVLVSIFSFGYYLYLAGQYKGFLKAIEVYLKYEEKKMKMTPEQKAFLSTGNCFSSGRMPVGVSSGMKSPMKIYAGK